MALENVKVITHIYIIKLYHKINMIEKSCLYSLKNVGNCTYRGIKYKLRVLLYTFLI